MPQLIKCNNCGTEFPHERLKYWKNVPSSTIGRVFFCGAVCCLEHEENPNLNYKSVYKNFFTVGDLYHAD